MSNQEPYDFFPGKAVWRQKKALVLLEVSENPGIDHEKISEKLRLNLAVVVKIMGELVDAGILESAQTGDDGPGWVGPSPE